MARHAASAVTTFFPGRCGRACDKKYGIVRRRRHGTAGAAPSALPGKAIQYITGGGSPGTHDARCGQKTGFPSRLFVLRFSFLKLR